MRKINYIITEAFADRPFSGNPAGIVPDASQLTDEEMQKIAFEFNMEFGFFTPPISSQADFRARFFTSICEARISGHVAVAACHALFSEGLVDFSTTETSKTIILETNAGLRTLTLRRSPTGEVTAAFDLARPRFGRIYDPHGVEMTLELPAKSVLATRLWPQVISTGVRVLVVPMRNREILYTYKPDMKKVARYSRALKIGGPVFCTMETLDSEADIYCRYFFPNYGTDEDISSGVALGAVCCYLIRHEILSVQDTTSVVSEQGHTLQRPNKMSAEIKVDSQGDVLSIKIVGQALVVSHGTFYLP
jgi:trans-2,3-dihydro-3-hydroxyanthranilate isomerase